MTKTLHQNILTKFQAVYTDLTNFDNGFDKIVIRVNEAEFQKFTIIFFGIFSAGFANITLIFKYNCVLNQHKMQNQI